MLTTIRATMLMIETKCMDQFMHYCTDTHATWTLKIHVLAQHKTGFEQIKESDLVTCRPPRLPTAALQPLSVPFIILT